MLDETGSRVTLPKAARKDTRIRIRALESEGIITLLFSMCRLFAGRSRTDYDLERTSRVCPQSGETGRLLPRHGRLDA